MNRSLAFPLVCVAALLCLGDAEAACGLHSVRIDSSMAQETLELGVSLRRTAVEYAGLSGDYSEISFDTRYSSGSLWAFGMQWPLAVLRLNDAVRTGMGNPAGFLEATLPWGPSARFSLGAQIGLPLGNLADGLASKHFMGGAYASITRSLGGILWNGTAGALFVFPPMDYHAGMSHDGTAQASMTSAPVSPAGLSFGHPHDNREILDRAAARKHLWKKRAALSVALDGQHILGKPIHSTAGSDFLILETGASILMGAATLLPTLQVPVSPARRIGWSLGLAGTVPL